MTDLERLKLLTDEVDPATSSPPSEGCPCGNEGEPLAVARLYTDRQLIQLMELHNGEVEATAYDVLIRKAHKSQVSLPGGIQLADQSKYWLRRAALLRKPQSHNIPRADDIPIKPPPKGDRE